MVAKWVPFSQAFLESPGSLSVPGNAQQEISSSTHPHPVASLYLEQHRSGYYSTFREVDLPRSLGRTELSVPSPPLTNSSFLSFVVDGTFVPSII